MPHPPAPPTELDVELGATTRFANADDALGPVQVDLEPTNNLLTEPRRDGASAGPLARDAFGARYELGQRLGAGGMGEVRLCRDRLIGRDVALKVMHADGRRKDDARERFTREARVQGQLEHPSVVPVYDLGVTPKGEPYFTMKRVRGMTLEAVLAGLNAGDRAISARYGRRRLLAAFNSVCLAVDFAHARGVLHRDLKPANVMLGDFGEVHLLDWGLAKIAGALDLSPASESSDEDPFTQPATATLEGAIMGTLGYMAPEQVRGEIDRLDARTDVYALGAILFEILALRPLHPGPAPGVLMQSTLRGADARPSGRAPAEDVPPELDAICVRATALDPAARYATARALSEAVERFLDGDRDLALRRELASEHAAAARDAAARALAPGAGATAARTEAIREVGRALALDPARTDALETLARLLIEPPAELPAEASDELDRWSSELRRGITRRSGVRYLVWMVYILAAIGLGVRDWRPIGATLAVQAIAITATFALAKRPVVRSAQGLVVLALSSLTIMGASAVCGPLILVPSMAATNALVFALQSDRRHRAVVAAITIATLLVPLLLEWVGVLPRSYASTPQGMLIVARGFDLPAIATQAYLLATSVGVTIAMLVLGRGVRDDLDRAERRLVLQAWSFRQLVPRTGASSAPPRP